MKFVILALVSFALNANSKLDDCMCQENIADCSVGSLTCSGKITDKNSIYSFSKSAKFGPDDDFTPTSSNLIRQFSEPPRVIDLKFYATTCDGHSGKVDIGLLVWKNESPSYPKLEKELNSKAVKKQKKQKI